MREMFNWKQKINPLWWVGNADDPIPPEWYRSGQNETIRKIMWALRNPLHNFTFYVIGVADKEHSVTGEYPEEVFNPDGGWKKHVVEVNGLKLPFISYSNGIKFYIGWRERGNFGIKLTKKRG